MTLDRFYPIFEDCDWLVKMLPLGVKLVQLRAKDLDEPAALAEVTAAKDLCAKNGAQLIVNDHWKAAIDAGCDYVHLGQEDLDTADVPALRRHGIRLGISTHDRAELERALSLDADYIALGPIYPTILKKMKWHEQGLDRVREWKDLIGERPLIGIGGMTIERATLVYAAGADVVSVVTDITLNADPAAQTRAWIEATR